jgi:small-conductance mechanosensitive channel
MSPLLQTGDGSPTPTQTPDGGTGGLLGSDGLLGPFASVLEPAGVFAVAFLLVAIVGRLVVDPAVDRLLARRDVDPTAELVFRRTSRVGYLAVGAFVGVGLAGFEVLLGGSALVIAALTFTLGVAGQDVVGNLVSGVFLVLDRNFRVGDWIRWQDQAGTVKDIGFRVTRVRTINNETITVPNTELATSAITTPYNGQTYRITLPLGIAYEDDPDEATEVLLAAARAQPDIIDIPTPAVRVTDFEDAYVALEVQFWVRDPKEMNLLRVRSTFARVAKRRLEEAGITLMPPSKHDLSGSLEVAGTTPERPPDPSPTAGHARPDVGGETETGVAAGSQQEDEDTGDQEPGCEQ